jgi:hypothetical protein
VEDDPADVQPLTPGAPSRVSGAGKARRGRPGQAFIEMIDAHAATP